MKFFGVKLSKGATATTEDAARVEIKKIELMANVDQIELVSSQIRVLEEKIVNLGLVAFDSETGRHRYQKDDESVIKYKELQQRLAELENKLASALNMKSSQIKQLDSETLMQYIQTTLGGSSAEKNSFLLVK